MLNPQAPLVIGQRLSGSVVKFDADVGMGEVEVSSGQRWIFHCTAIADGSRDIDQGVDVSFVVSPGAPGRWEAADLQQITV